METLLRIWSLIMPLPTPPCIRSLVVYCFLVVRHSVIPRFRRSEFITAQYLKNELMELDQILHMHRRWPELHWDCYSFFFFFLFFFLFFFFFCKFTIRLWPLVTVKISFPLNILWTNWWNLIKFCKYLDLNQIEVEIVTLQISKINNRATVLNYRLTSVSDQYLENESIELDKILHIH